MITHHESRRLLALLGAQAVGGAKLTAAPDLVVGAQALANTGDFGTPAVRAATATIRLAILDARATHDAAECLILLRILLIRIQLIIRIRIRIIIIRFIYIRIRILILLRI